MAGHHLHLTEVTNESWDFKTYCQKHVQQFLEERAGSWCVTMRYISSLSMTQCSIILLSERPFASSKHPSKGKKVTSFNMSAERLTLPAEIRGGFALLPSQHPFS